MAETPPPPEPILDPSRTPGPPPEPERLSFFTVLLQFFLIPVLIVVACAGLFFGLRALVGKAKTPDDLLTEVREGGINRRWQAAFELCQVLSQDQAPSLAPDFVDRAITAFHDSASDDHRIQEYLALVLGLLHDKKGTRPMLEALPGAAPALRANILWGLGEIGDEAARVPLLKALNEVGDGDVQKVALRGLKRLPRDEATLTEIRAHLVDPTIDVKWNSALVLGYFNDPSGADVLESMLDRDRLEKEVAPPEQRGEADPVGSAMMNALSAAARLYSERFRPRFTELSRNDKDPNVRELARQALEWLDQKK